jgi:hypothetical protein
VRPGDERTSKHSAPGLWALLDRLPRERWPALVRGDAHFGVELIMAEAEAKGVPYLFKLRLTANVKRMIEKLAGERAWIDAGAGFEAKESLVRLTGWSRQRRAIVLRRRIRDGLALAAGEEAFGQLYRDRGDSERLRRTEEPVGLGGFTTQDLARCRLEARLLALFNDWWNTFVRLAEPDRHREAFTSRPLLFAAIAAPTCHARQTTIRVTNSHAKALPAAKALAAVAAFLRGLAKNAEQLTRLQIWRAILARAFKAFLKSPIPVRLAPTGRNHKS